MGGYEGTAVYIMASQRNGTLYIGVTSDVLNRVLQHKTGATPGFAAKYGCKRLVWLEAYADIRDAIHREKQLKRWLRAWKLRLIEEGNPEWRDLSDGWYAEDDGRLVVG